MVPLNVVDRRNKVAVFLGGMLVGSILGAGLRVCLADNQNTKYPEFGNFEYDEDEVAAVDPADLGVRGRRSEDRSTFTP